MNIEHLEYILEIYKSKSINSASKKLFISQPRLSLLLKNVEDDLGYAIFTRSNSGIQPTELGAQFLAIAADVFERFMRLKSLHKDKQAEEDNLSVSACFCSLFSHIFFNFKGKYRSASPRQDVYNEVSYFPRNVAALVAQKNRIAVTYFEPKDACDYKNYANRYGLTLFALDVELPIRAVVPLGHPLAAKTEICLRDLSYYRIVTYHDVEYDVLLGRNGFNCDMDIQYVSCRASYYDALRLGGCISTSVDFAPGEAERLGCLCLPIVDAGCAVPAYIVPDDCTLNPRERAFLDYFTAAVTQAPLDTAPSLPSRLTISSAG